MSELPQDVINLVVAGRIATYDEPDSPEARRSLDKALEAFADRVPWDDQPDDVEVSTASQTHFPPSAQGGMAKELKTLFYDGYSCGHDAAKAQQWGRPPPDAERECVKALSSISLRSEAEVKAEGAREERERLVALLDDQFLWHIGWTASDVNRIAWWLRSQSSEGEDYE